MAARRAPPRRLARIGTFSRTDAVRVCRPPALADSGYWAQRAMAARPDARASLALLTAPVAVVMGENLVSNRC